MIAKNKTKFCPSLKIDGTLSSILTIRLANLEPYHKFEPPREVLTRNKQPTSQYTCIIKLILVSKRDVGR